MSSLVHPRGPEPERTYWIRRGIVLLALVLTLLVISSIIRTLFGHGSATAGPVVTPNPSSLAGTPMVTPSDTGTPSASASSPSASASSASPSATPSANPLCSASTTGVGLTADPTSLASGATTQLQVKFTNTGQNPCRINFGQTPLSLSVTSGIDHIWSNASCPAWAPHGLSPEVKPGTSWTFSQAWTTKRSGAGCTLKTTQLLPGTYVASASLSGGQASSRIITLHS